MCRVYTFEHQACLEAHAKLLISIPTLFRLSATVREVFHAQQY